MGDQDLAPLVLAILRVLVEDKKVAAAAETAWACDMRDLFPVSGEIAVCGVARECSDRIVVLPDRVCVGLARLLVLPLVGAGEANPVIQDVVDHGVQALGAARQLEP